MMGAYRFYTDCLTGIRHWRWFARVGRPERAIFAPCAKLAALGLPLLVGPMLPPFSAWPGFGGVGGFPAAPYAEYGAAPFGWGTTPGLSAGGLIYPTSLTAGGPEGYPAAAWANPVPQQMRRVRSELPGETPGAETGVSTPAPVPVPEPGSLHILLGLLVVAILGLLPVSGE